MTNIPLTVRTLLHRFLQLRTAPRTDQTPVRIAMMAFFDFLEKRTVDILFHTTSAQRKRQLLVRSIRKNRVVETLGRQHSALDQTKIVADVRAGRVVNELWMTHGVAARLIDIWIE